MSVAERREAVRGLVQYGLSVQRACVLLQIQRASFQYQPRSVVPDEVTTEIAALAVAHPRYGYRRITQRVPGAAAAQTDHQSQACASAVEARPLAGAATKTPTAAP
jgi:hypothetical protein